MNLLNNIENTNVIFPMGYKTQEILRESNYKLGNHIKVIDPIGYLEFMYLLKNSEYVATDSGTVVEEACILGIPSIQMRYSTERPEVYDVKASVKFDPTVNDDSVISVINKVNGLISTKWSNPFGDGTASEIIVNDLVELSKQNNFKKHNSSDYPFDVSNSFKG